MGLFRRSHSFKLSPLSLSVPLGGCDTVVGLQELQRKKDSDLLAKALNLSSTYGTSPASDSNILLLEVNSHAGHGKSYSFHPNILPKLSICNGKSWVSGALISRCTQYSACCTSASLCRFSWEVWTTATAWTILVRHQFERHTAELETLARLPLGI